MKVDSLNFIKRLNIFSVLFLISFGILLNVSASSVEGLNLYGDNFYFIKRHLTAIIIGAIISGGLFAMARATATLCCSPPDNS